MKRVLLIFSIVFSFPLLINGQSWIWGKGGVGLTPSSSIECRTVSSDSAGNVFIAGWYTGSMAFGTNTITAPGGSADIFLAKYDPNGNIQWAKSAGSGGSASNTDEARSVSVDKFGNIFITGLYFSPSVVFGTYTLSSTPANNGAVYIAKYDSNGNILWAKSSNTGWGMGLGVTTDKIGNSFITGINGGGGLTFGTYTLTGGADNLFLVKYDPNGNELWAREALNAYLNYTFGISTDKFGNVFVGGFFISPTMTIGSYTLTNYGTESMFLAKYDSNGNVLWAKSSIGSNIDLIYSVSADINGDVYVTGEFTSPTLVLGTYTLTNPTGVVHAFFAKYDSNGNVVWAKCVTGGGADSGYGVSTDIAGNAWFTGSFQQPITIGSTTINTPTTASAPAFLIEFDTNGNIICTSTLDEGGNSNTAISTDYLGNVYIGSDFSFSPFVVGSSTLTSAFGQGAFVAKFKCTTTNIHSLVNDNKNILVSPNPNSGSFKLQIDSEIKNGEMILMNSLGQKVHEKKITQGENEIMVKDLAKGLYHYIILQGNQQISTGKIAIE